MCFASWQDIIEPYIMTVTSSLTSEWWIQMVAVPSWRPRPGKLDHTQFLNGFFSFGLENDRLSANVFYNSKE